MTWEVLQPILAKLEPFLLQAGLDAFSGLPAPHEETHLVGGADELAEPGTPTTVDAGSTATAGLGPSFAREDHEHAVTTGTPVDLGEALAEGSGAPLARASHVHKLLTRIAKAGSTTGTRKAVNFIDGSGITVTCADNSGSDRVDVTVALSGGGVAGMANVLAWLL